MRSYLGKHTVSEPTPAETLELRMRSYHQKRACLIYLDACEDLEKRTTIEREFLDQTDRERREIQVTSNIERIR